MNMRNFRFYILDFTFAGADSKYPPATDGAAAPQSKIPNLKSKISASALPLVLWGIAFVAALVVMAALWVGQLLEEETYAGRRFHAQQLALRGLAFGMHNDITPADPLLREGTEAEDGEGYEVRILNESGRINPNSVVNPENRDLFLKLFESWDVPLDKSQAAIDSLIDWVSETEFSTLTGAKRADYQALGLEGMPPNAPMTNVNEMAYVLYLRDILAERENWQENFTVWTTGKINIKHASAELLSTLGEFSDIEIERLQDYIAGEDGIIGTQDDGQLSSIEDALAVAGISDQRTEQIAKFFDVQGDLRRVESTGFSNGVRYKISVVVSNGQPIFWEEK